MSALLTALLSMLIFNAVNWERNYLKLDIRVLVILPLVAIFNFMSKAADCGGVVWCCGGVEGALEYHTLQH